MTGKSEMSRNTTEIFGASNLGLVYHKSAAASSLLPQPPSHFVGDVDMKLESC